MGEREFGQGRRVLMDLVIPYFGSWMGVTVDSFFTSAALAEEIFNKRNNMRIC